MCHARTTQTERPDSVILCLEDQLLIDKMAWGRFYVMPLEEFYLPQQPWNRPGWLGGGKLTESGSAN